MKKPLLATLIFIVAATQAHAAVKTKTITYKHGDVALKGFLAWDDAFDGKRPGVLIVHEWWGLNDYAQNRAKQLAEMGYAAFAVDMYGGGKVTEHPQEAGKWAGMVRKNQKQWRQRALLGLKVLKSQKMVDGKRLAAIGYCFGGSTALQLAFAGAPLKAVVSFHGALPVPTPKDVKAVKGTILVCHGADDGFIKKETIEAFRSALDKGKVNYDFIAYPGAVHSFTVPGADKRGIKGIAYNEKADRHSWASMQKLFKQVFGEK